MVSIWFGEFVLPPTTILEKHEEIGNALRSYDQLNKLVQAVGDRFPFLVVGGAIRDLLVNADIRPKDIDLQMFGSKDDIMAQLKQHYDEEDLATNAIAIVVGKSTDSMDAIDVRQAVDTYF